MQDFLFEAFPSIRLEGVRFISNNCDISLISEIRLDCIYLMLFYRNIYYDIIIIIIIIIFVTFTKQVSQ